MESPSIRVVLVVSVCLAATAIALMAVHVRSWRAMRGQPLDAEEAEYRRRQFRRRMWTSALLGVLAVALSGGHWLVFWVHSNWFEIGYWGAAMLLACWLGVLAVLDMRATHRHFMRQRNRCFQDFRRNDDS